MIGIWGSREEKIEASFYFFFYTLIGSFLMLLSIFKIYSSVGNSNLLFIYSHNIAYSEVWIFLGILISLSIKIPMVPVHLWLPKAHVEAPIAGSVLLAGVLLKLGGYGYFRLILPITPQSLSYFSPLLIMISLIAIVYGAFSTLRQNDLKKLIAYSSISHMGIVTLCIFIKSTEGLIASILMMLSHGFISSAMFIFSFILYSRHHTRIFKYYKGLTVSMPIFSSITLLVILGNIGFPLTLNFVSEILAIKSAISFSIFSALVLCLGSFITLIYSLYMYNRIFFGQISSYLIYSRDLLSYEFQPLLFLFIITLFFGVLPNFIIKIISVQIFFFNTF